MLVLGSLATCNNEPPECSTEQFPPLICQLSHLSGKKIDSTIIYLPQLDSVLYSVGGMPEVVRIPISIDSDTTFAQFTLIGISSTAILKEISVLGIASTPELTITNLECGPFYCFHDLSYTLYSMSGIEPTYEIVLDTFSVDTTIYKINYDSLGVAVDTQLMNTTMTLVDTLLRKTGTEHVDYQMSIDSLHFFTKEIDENYEVHAKIFF